MAAEISFIADVGGPLSPLNRGLFYGTALFCALATAGLAIVLGGVSGGYLWATRRKTAS